MRTRGLGLLQRGGMRRRSSIMTGKRPSIEVVTQDQFKDLENMVNKLLSRSGPPPLPTMPKSKKLMEDIAKGSASLTDVMQAMQLAARVDATEKALERMAQMMTALALSGALPKDLADSVKSAAEKGLSAIAKDAQGKKSGGKGDRSAEDDTKESKRKRKAGDIDEDDDEVTGVKRGKRGKGEDEYDETDARGGKRGKAGGKEDYDEGDAKGGKRGKAGGKDDYDEGDSKGGKRGKAGKDDYDEDDGKGRRRDKEGRGRGDDDDDGRAVGAKAGGKGKGRDDDDDKDDRGRGGKGKGRDYDDDDRAAGGKGGAKGKGRDYDDDDRAAGGKGGGKGKGLDYDDDDRGDRGKARGRDDDDRDGGKGGGKGKGRNYDDDDRATGGKGGGKGKGRDYDDDDRGDRGKAGEKSMGRDDDDDRGRSGKGKGRDYDDDDRTGGKGGGKGKGRDYDDDDRGAVGKGGAKGKGRDYDDDDRASGGKGGRKGKGRDYDDDDRDDRGRVGKGKGRDYDDDDRANRGKGGGKGKGRDYDDDDRAAGGKGGGRGKGRDYDDDDRATGGKGGGKGKGRDYDDDDRDDRGRGGKGKGRDYDNDDRAAGGKGGGRGKGQDYDEDETDDRGRGGGKGRGRDDDEDRTAEEKAGGKGKGRDYDDDDRAGGGKGGGKGKGRDFDDDSRAAGGKGGGKGKGRDDDDRADRGRGGGKRRDQDYDDDDEDEREYDDGGGRKETKTRSSEKMGGTEPSSRRSTKGAKPTQGTQADVAKQHVATLTQVEICPIARWEMNAMIEELKQQMMKNLASTTSKAITSAETAVAAAKTMAGKQDEVLTISNRLNKLQNTVSEYAGQLHGFDSGLSHQFTNFNEQMGNIKKELAYGLQQLEAVNTNSETAAVSELMDHYQNLTAELEATLHNHNGLLSAQMNLASEIEAMDHNIEILREEKADLEEVKVALRDKADISKLEGLLTEDMFLQINANLENKLDACYIKFQKQNNTWENAMRELTELVRSKADMQMLLKNRNIVQDDLNDMYDKIKKLDIMIGEPEAALLARQLAVNAVCGACMVNAYQNVMQEPKPPCLRPLRPPNQASLTDTKEDDTCKRNYPPDYRDHMCHRWVGGSHTLLTDTVSRRRAPPMDYEPLPVKPYDAYGSDGKIYKLEEELLPCQECNVVLPPLKKESSVKIKARPDQELGSFSQHGSRGSLHQRMSQQRLSNIRRSLQQSSFVTEDRPTRISLSIKRESKKSLKKLKTVTIGDDVDERRPSGAAIVPTHDGTPFERRETIEFTLAELSDPVDTGPGETDDSGLSEAEQGVGFRTLADDMDD